MAVCGRCGEENPERARFCLACGSELARSGSETRKTITVLFADMVDSTGLGERLDPEALRGVMTRYFECAEIAIKAHGGKIEKFIGDAVMAVFGIPQAHEDDALRAVRAAEELQSRIILLNEERPEGEPISVRVGINTGEVIAGSGPVGRTDVVGDAVNAAARLEKLAAPGGIVMGSSTHRLVRDSVSSEAMGPITVKGKEAPLEAHIVLAVHRGSALPRSYETPMVGRERELEALEHAFERVVSDNVCVLFTVLGVAGIGKSRLVAELQNRVASPLVLTGRCLPYGDGITFWPITESISEAAHISDRDSQEEATAKIAALVAGAEESKIVATLVGQVLGLGEQTASQEEIFWAVRKTFETLAASAPLILVFDDIHWAEPTFLDLVDHIVEWGRDVPILVLCLARPELLENRTTWGGGKLNATTMLLEALRESESRQLFSAALGETSSIEPLLPRILEVAEGNPFFLEETIAMLVDEGVIEKRGDTWVARSDIDSIDIPPTINALLTARLDQLPDDERVAIELASVMGKVFASQAVRDLATEHTDTGAALEGLSRKGLLQLDQEEFAGEEMYRFRHLLIRDAAYQGVPKERRAVVHQHYAEWLIDVLGERSVEYLEIIGYHLELSHRYVRELNPEDASAVELARRAGSTLADAGRRAYARDDYAATSNLLTRALELLPQDDEDSSNLMVELGAAMKDEGDFSAAEAILQQAEQRALHHGHQIAATRARLHLEESHIHTLKKSAEEARVAAETAIAAFEELHDDIGLAHAWRLLSYSYDTVGKSSESQDAMSRAVRHAEATGDEVREYHYRRIHLRSLSWSPIPMSQLAKETHDFIATAEARGDRRGQALAMGILGVVEASVGNFEVAHELIAGQRRIYEDLGLDLARAWAIFETATVDSLAGDLDSAERELRWSCDLLQKKEEKAVYPTVLALLADIRCSQDDLDEAETLIAMATGFAVEDDFLTQIKCRSVKGKIASGRGKDEEALELARAAVAIAERTEYLDWRANAWVDLAEIAARHEHVDEARAALVRAIDLYDQKEMTYPSRKASERLGALSP